ncbi:MAG: hypothetical protein HYV07_17185 [Deltaproteobacteria bacterium]|nr:hypothetical protein [Deltaproteobacteria bacterium]
MKKTLTEIFEKYGPVALGTYLVIFALAWVGFAAAIELGYSPEGLTGSAGVWTAAYVATKLTQPIRIGMTLVLTPAIAAGWRRLRPPSSSS